MSVSTPQDDQINAYAAGELKLLRQFDAFSCLPCWALIPLSSAAELRHYAAGEPICTRGDNSDDEFFLLRGAVRLTAADGRSQLVEGGTPLANKPLALLRPRKYELHTETPSNILILSQSHYRCYIEEMRPLNGGDMLLDESSLYARFQQDLEHQTITLPTHPVLTAQIKKQLRQGEWSKAELAQCLMGTPAITLSLMRLASSALFREYGPCTTLEQLIDRLGVKNCTALIRVFCEHSLDQESSPALLELNQRLHRDALEVAALCCVIARLCPHSFNIETAALVGLWHNIGLILIESYLHQSPQFADQFGNLEKISKDLGSPIGQELMESWKLPALFRDAQKNLNNWSYHSSAKGDYNNLLVCAQAHHHLMHPESYPLPPLGEIPAIQILSGGAVTPDESIEIIRQAKLQLNRFLPARPLPNSGDIFIET